MVEVRMNWSLIYMYPWGRGHLFERLRWWCVWWGLNSPLFLLNLSRIILTTFLYNTMNREFSLFDHEFGAFPTVICKSLGKPSYITPPYLFGILNQCLEFSDGIEIFLCCFFIPISSYSLYCRYHLQFPVVTIAIYTIWFFPDWCIEKDPAMATWLFFPSIHLVIILIDIAFIETCLLLSLCISWTKRSEICIPLNPAYSHIPNFRGIGGGGQQVF